MSRPRKTATTRMSRKITFRLTQKEYDLLTSKAALLGISANQLARKLALGGTSQLVIKTYKRFDPALIAQLHRIGNNLNQLIKNAHIFKRVSPQVASLCDKIETIVFQAIDDEVDE